MVVVKFAGNRNKDSFTHINTDENARERLLHTSNRQPNIRKHTNIFELKNVLAKHMNTWTKKKMYFNCVTYVSSVYVDADYRSDASNRKPHNSYFFCVLLSCVLLAAHQYKAIWLISEPASHFNRFNGWGKKIITKRRKKKTTAFFSLLASVQ